MIPAEAWKVIYKLPEIESKIFFYLFLNVGIDFNGYLVYSTKDLSLETGIDNLIINVAISSLIGRGLIREVSRDVYAIGRVVGMARDTYFFYESSNN